MVHDGCQVLWVSFSHPHSRVEAVPNRAHGSFSDGLSISVGAFRKYESVYFPK
jgi:hypothetical protein